MQKRIDKYASIVKYCIQDYSPHSSRQYIGGHKTHVLMSREQQHRPQTAQARVRATAAESALYKGTTHRRRRRTHQQSSHGHRQRFGLPGPSRGAIAAAASGDAERVSREDEEGTADLMELHRWILQVRSVLHSFTQVISDYIQ